jgi:hypothetical protein
MHREKAYLDLSSEVSISRAWPYGLSANTNEVGQGKVALSIFEIDYLKHPTYSCQWLSILLMDSIDTAFV